MATDIATMTGTGRTGKADAALWAILAILGVYAATLLAGWPQHWTDLAVGAHAATPGDRLEGHGLDGPAAEEHVGGGHGGASQGPLAAPALFSIIPFVMLLLAIAVLPLLHATEHWWEENVNRFKVAAALGVVTLGYYAFLHRSAIESHWPAHSVVDLTESVFQTGLVLAVLGNAVLQEYIPFIVLLFSLYTIAGGIRIEGDLRAHPLTNASFMAVGGALASFVGTTGAAMLLIRPLLETNRERKHVKHTVIFFIFIVCNCGGCLLPIGDPPLFLGYLEGVSFTWTLGLWEPWLFVNGLLLLVYCVLDQVYFYPKETLADVQRDIRQTRRLSVRGVGLNGPLLLGVVLAVALLDPKKSVPGLDWHPWMYLREAVQITLVAASLYFGSRRIRDENRFNYDAIVEVAALFIGIFICMQPALQILGANGSRLVEQFQMGPSRFFWATGFLSAFLDNAPTYLVFFKTAQDPAAIAGSATGGVNELLLIGISLGSVFMGAMTYIGNGPNFMVKAIAEKSGVRMPSFFGYMAYSCAVLLPVFALASWKYLGSEDLAAEAAETAEVRTDRPVLPIAPGVALLPTAPSSYNAAPSLRLSNSGWRRLDLRGRSQPSVGYPMTRFPVRHL